MNEDIGIGIGFIVLIALVATGILWAVASSRQWTEECERRGGHRRGVYKSAPLCLSEDGRVIEW